MRTEVQATYGADISRRGRPRRRIRRRGAGTGSRCEDSTANEIEALAAGSHDGGRVAKLPDNVRLEGSFVHVHEDTERFAAAVGVLFHSCVTGGLSEKRVVQSPRKTKGRKASQRHAGCILRRKLSL